MKLNGWAQAVLIVAGTCAVVGIMTAVDWAEWVCRSPAGESGKPLAPGFGGCLEFWINRYQGLIGAFVTVAAAAIAWLGIQRQIAAATGDIPPDMVLLPASDGRPDEAILRITNHNRRQLLLNGVELIRPERVPLVVYYEGPEGDEFLNKTDNTRRVSLGKIMPGVRPSAADVPCASFKIMFPGTYRPDRTFARGIEVQVVVELNFEFPGQAEPSVRRIPQTIFFRN